MEWSEPVKPARIQVQTKFGTCHNGGNTRNINCVLGSSLNTQAKFAGAIRARSKNLQLEIVNINMNPKAPGDAEQPATALARSTRKQSGRPVDSGLRSAQFLARQIVAVVRADSCENAAQQTVGERTHQIQENRLPKTDRHKRQLRHALRPEAFFTVS
jgi:hypothetical protein